MAHLQYILFNVVEAKSFQQLKITNCNKIIRRKCKKKRHSTPASYFIFLCSSIAWPEACWYCSICWPSVEVRCVRCSSSASICAIRSTLAWLSTPVAWLMLEEQMSDAQTTHTSFNVNTRESKLGARASTSDLNHGSWRTAEPGPSPGLLC